MIFLSDWAQEEILTVGQNSLRLLSVNDSDVYTASQNLAQVLPEHYVNSHQLAQAFGMLGKPGVANWLKELFPSDRKMQSGDCGEILATEYIRERTNYIVPINRLRWKDSRQTSMRGDDVIGIREAFDNTGLHFLKTESKSRATLRSSTLKDVRERLDSNDGLPSAHGVLYVAARLLEEDEDDLSYAIIKAQLSSNVSPDCVQHLAFVFTGNSPASFLQRFLKEYDGNFSQIAVGLQISTHPDFVQQVFDLALSWREP